MDRSFEAVPKYYRMPPAVLRDRFRSVALKMLASGQRISIEGLRARGARGSTNLLRILRAELVAAGELPPEAAPRPYNSSGRRGKASPPPPEAEPTPAMVEAPDRKPFTRRLFIRYEIAVSRVFGDERARQMRATRLRLRPRGKLPASSPMTHNQASPVGRGGRQMEVIHAGEVNR
jgi:hypothetical protein